MNKFKRSKTLSTLHRLGLVGELPAEERKTVLRNFTRLYPDFLCDLESLADDAMESNDRTQAVALCDDLRACCEVLIQYPEDAAEILEALSEIEVILLKDRLEGGKVVYKKEVSQLFLTPDDCRSFFDCEGANTMTCADWAKRAFKFVQNKKLELNFKNDRKTLHTAIKEKHPNIAELKTFQETLRNLNNRAL